MDNQKHDEVWRRSPYNQKLQGIIIINDRPARVTVDNGTEVYLRGTHLITFKDRVVINDTFFINHDKAQIRDPGVASSPLLNITANRDIPSLPYLHQLSKRNLEFIKPTLYTRYS